MESPSTIALLSAPVQRRRYILLLSANLGVDGKIPGFAARADADVAPHTDPAHHARAATAGPAGKVRDIYDFGDRLIVVATDRISAFDYVLGSGIPDKGKVLTQISDVLVRDACESIVPNHVHLHASGRLSG